MTPSFLSTVTLAGAYASALDAAHRYDRAQTRCARASKPARRITWAAWPLNFARRLRLA